MTSRSRPPQQRSLFDDPDTAAESAALVAVAAGRGPLSPAQKTFNRLTNTIRRQRAQLAEWEAFLPRFQQRVHAELEPVSREIRDVQRRLVARLHLLLTAREPKDRLSRRHRSAIRGQMLAVIEDILSDGPDAELEALHASFSDVSLQQLREDELAMIEDVLGNMMGVDLTREHAPADIEELVQHARAKLTEQIETEERTRQERAAERAMRRGRPTKAELAAERRAQAERDASQSVREIFRRLASALHPDREADEAERERKTGLMQRVNQAYERSDLLELLALQMEIEQIDTDHLRDAPESRLQHFNTVLREQSRALKAQIEERVAPFRFQFDLYTDNVTIKAVENALTAQIHDWRVMSQEMERDLAALEDRRTRRQVLNRIPDPEDDVAELLAMTGFLDADFEPDVHPDFDPFAPPVRRRPKRKKKRAKKQRR